MGYKDDLEIDKYALDEEWEKQSLLYMKWAERHAEAIKERDILWQKKKVLRAELDQEIRQSFMYEGMKFTETLIDSKIRMRKEYQEVQERLIEANKNVNVLDSAKWAMDSKKKALENMTSLWLGGYYSEPRIPAEAREQSYKKKSNEVKRIHRQQSGLKRRK